MGFIPLNIKWAPAACQMLDANRQNTDDIKRKVPIDFGFEFGLWLGITLTLTIPLPLVWAQAYSGPTLFYLDVLLVQLDNIEFRRSSVNVRGREIRRWLSPPCGTREHETRDGAPVSAIDPVSERCLMPALSKHNQCYVLRPNDRENVIAEDTRIRVSIQGRRLPYATSDLRARGNET